MNMWAGAFGDEYTKRNMESHYEARASIWKMLMPINCQSVLEVGANVGLNLEAISLIKDVEIYAAEPNDLARETLIENNVTTPNRVTADYADKLSFPTDVADLVITSGLLIHIPPDKLLASMREIHRCAKKWIICGEYFSPQEEMIQYRGHDNAMWRRDYGSLWLDNFPDLQSLSCVFAWKRMTGMDNLTFWCFEKRHVQ